MALCSARDFGPPFEWVISLARRDAEDSPPRPLRCVLRAGRRDHLQRLHPEVRQTREVASNLGLRFRFLVVPLNLRRGLRFRLDLSIAPIRGLAVDLNTMTDVLGQIGVVRYQQVAVQAPVLSATLVSMYSVPVAPGLTQPVTVTSLPFLISILVLLVVSLVWAPNPTAHITAAQNVALMSFITPPMKRPATIVPNECPAEHRHYQSWSGWSSRRSSGYR